MESVAWLRQLVTEEGIDCDFRDCDACLYTTGDPASLDAEYDACRDLGMEVYRAGDSELPFPAQVLGLRHQARFHPLKLTSYLAREGNIREHTRVLDVDGTTVLTDHGTVTAGQVIGAVGTTAAAESAQGPHLHFSVTKDGDAVDPEEYLNK